MKTGDIVYDRLDPKRRPMIVVEMERRERSIAEWWRGEPARETGRAVVRFRLESPELWAHRDADGRTREVMHYYDTVTLPTAQLVAASFACSACGSPAGAPCRDMLLCNNDRVVAP